VISIPEKKNEIFLSEFPFFIYIFLLQNIDFLLAVGYFKTRLKKLK
jgi:hypothetical protein